MKKILFCILILSLSGCATSYRQSGTFMLDGYQEKTIAPDTFTVSFKGNLYTNIEKTYAYAMKRAAEITLAHGDSYFEVLNHRNYFAPLHTDTSAGSFTTDLPTSEVTIKIMKQKTAKSYNAQKVFSSVTG